MLLQNNQRDPLLLTPTIIITRPALQGEAFAAALREASPVPLDILLAPLLRIDPVTPPDLKELPQHVIFTSVNGVNQASRFKIPPAAVAWCVGDQTSQAAAAQGFTVRNARGNSAALTDLIITARPDGPMVHLRGAHATGHVVERLSAAGLTCTAHTVYAQATVPPSPQLLQALQSAAPAIIPLFSPRSAKLVSALGQPKAPATFIAISKAAMTPVSGMQAVQTFIAPTPDKTGMVNATMTAVQSFSP